MNEIPVAQSQGLQQQRQQHWALHVMQSTLILTGPGELTVWKEYHGVSHTKMERSASSLHKAVSPDPPSALCQPCAAGSSLLAITFLLLSLI